ncbi:MAG: 4Fe-4S binding protein [Methanocorpusculum sp.]|nr:4Fe-4S binding protein [Methanocorpusculum sp.]
MTVFSYFKEFLRPSSVKAFFCVKTAPLKAPAYFRDFPALTGKKCTNCLTCRMICPCPGAIDVVMENGVWTPHIVQGHCVRCGYCVEACPEEVLTSGDILEKKHMEGLSFRHEYTVLIDTGLCMGCGNCATACPANREADPHIGAGGTAFSDTVLMRVERGKNTVLHTELCKGCKVCMDTCPNSAIHVVRRVEAVQEAKHD